MALPLRNGFRAHARWEQLCGSRPVEYAAGSGVDPLSDLVEVADGELTQVSSLPEVLPQQSVHVLDRAALPG